MEPLPLEKVRKFGIVLSFILFLFSAVHLLFNRYNAFIVSLCSGSAVLGITTFFPLWLVPLYRLMLGIGHIVGWVNTRVVLILVYYFILTPISLLVRLMGKDMLARKIDKKADTYWVKREISGISPGDLKKQF